LVLVCWLLVLFGLVLLDLVWWILQLPFIPLVWIFSWLGLQGGQSFEPIYWLFGCGQLFCTVSNLHPDTDLAVLVYPDTCEGKCFVITLWSKMQAVEWLKGFVLACGPQP